MCACTERLSLSLREGIIDCAGAQTMLYLTCSMISSVELAQYGISHAKDWGSVNCGTKFVTMCIICVYVCYYAIVCHIFSHDLP